MPGGPSSALDPPDAGTPVSAAPGPLNQLEQLAPGDAPSRPSRWDRPPEPKDWRWFIGGLGRTLISVGVLMFAFVGYQLYGTGIQTAQAQNRLESEFEDLLATAGGDTPATEITAPTPTVTPETVPATVPTEPDTEPDTEPVPAPSSTVPAARLTPPPQGDPLAKLTIPKIDLEKIVIEGVRTSDLEDGPGHFPETPLPGQYGNAAIAGHRTTHGQPFNRIDELQVGDEVIVETIVGRFTYLVTGQVIVSPNDYQLVIPTTDPTVATLTLTSCHPKLSAKQRIVVTAVLDPERSDLVTAPYVPPAGDAAAPSVIPGDDLAGTSSPETTTAATTPDSAPDTTLAAAGDDVTPSLDDALAGGSGSLDTADLEETASASQDLFENSWFSDPAAFPQVAIWGVLLTLVALGATALSRRVRRNWVGALVGIGPFVVVLYFWFENVNRLLPPNL
ncbi:MAG: class E sortase [Actinobacteria bacterium]|nr:class E sortase [Actinomycetota bacterium]